MVERVFAQQTLAAGFVESEQTQDHDKVGCGPHEGNRLLNGNAAALLGFYFALVSQSGTWPVETMRNWFRSAGLKPLGPILLRGVPGSALVLGRKSVQSRPAPLPGPRRMYTAGNAPWKLLNTGVSGGGDDGPGPEHCCREA